MEENNEIDNFDLSQAKRNMAKMLNETKSHAGLKKIFPDDNVVYHEEPVNPAQTINIYPNQGNNDQSLIFAEYLKNQQIENERLKQQIESLKSIEGRLAGLEVSLKGTIDQNRNLLEAPKTSGKPWYFLGFSSVLLILISFLLINFDQDQKNIDREPAIVKNETTVKQVGADTKLEKMVTVKFVNLRSKPSVSKGVIEKTISPNQLVEVLSKKGNWFQIKHIDLLKEQTMTGWTYGEFLKKVH